MANGNIREIRKVFIRDLQYKIEFEKGVIRVGATERAIQQRAREYELEGYSGIMFYAETTNLNSAENALLQLASENKVGIHNVHRNSNVGNENGYVYIIQGKKFN